MSCTMLLRLLPRHHALYYAPSINYTIAWSYMRRHANGHIEGSLDLPFSHRATEILWNAREHVVTAK